MARLDKEQWAIIRERWEDDEREGYAWIVAEMSVDASADAVKKRSYREKWKKKTRPPVIENVVPDAVPAGTNRDNEDKPEIGRPTKFKEEYIEQAFRLALLGCTDAEMADVFGVTEQTLNNWKVSQPGFFESIKNGKTPADAVVATSLYDRARGYAHEDVHISNFQGQITVTPITKHYPPDFQSASLWLRNRQPEKWRKDRVVKDRVIDPFPDIAALDEIKRKGLEKAMQEELKRRERREKLGINISGLLTGSDEI